jgi:hypothetical protein
MRDDMREALGETVQGLLNLGLPTTFTKKQLDELGVAIPEVEVPAARIREIRSNGQPRRCPRPRCEEYEN